MAKWTTLTILGHDPGTYAAEVVVDISLLPQGTKEGDIWMLKSQDGRKLYFTAAQKPPQSVLQLSISLPALNGLGLQPRAQVKARAIGTSLEQVKRVRLNYVELHFKGMYLTRMDQYRIGRTLTGQCVYSGQRVSFLGGLVRLQVDALYRTDHRVFSGYIDFDTKLIFRSDSSRMLIFIQMSAEMWNFDETGDIMFHRLVNSFLPEMLHRWRDKGDHHLVSIILFTSVESSDSTSRLIAHSSEKIRSSPEGEKHFYRVVVDQVHISQWSDIMRVLRMEFAKFPQEVLVGDQHQIEGRIKSSSNSNALEAFELATTLLTAKFLDKDLCRATSQVLVATPGAGAFNVDFNDLYQLSKTLLGVEIGVELVCLARPPVHITPLFCARDQNNDRHWCVPTWINVSFWSSPDRYVKQWIPRCRIYDLQLMGLLGPEVRGFAIRSVTPHPQTLNQKFMQSYDTSVFNISDSVRDQECAQSPSDKIFRPQALAAPKPVSASVAVGVSMGSPVSASIDSGGAKIALSGLLNQKVSKDSIRAVVWHDHSTGHQAVNATDSLGMKATPSDQENDGHMAAVKMSTVIDVPKGTVKSRNNESRPSSFSPRQHSKLHLRLMQEQSATSSSPNKQDHSRSKMDNSSIPTDTNGMWRELSNPAVIDQPSSLEAFGRWANVYPPARRQNTVSWRSLKSPASLPLTTEACPGLAQFQTEYTFQFYQVMPEDMGLPALVEEMIGLRLQMGFQIAIGSGVRRIESSLPGGDPDRIAQMPPMSDAEGTRIYLIRLGLIHRLAIEEGHVDIQLYTWTKLDSNLTKGGSRLNKAKDIFVKTRYDQGYHSFDTKSLLSLQPPNLNWSQLDQQIGNYQEIFSAGNENLVKIRYSLIPAEGGSGTYMNSNISRPGTLTLEELRLEGITKCVNLLLKHRLGNSNTSSNASHEAFPVYFYTGSLLKALADAAEGGDVDGNIKFLQTNRLSKKIKLPDLAAEMCGSMGVRIRTRRWHWKTHHNVFVGHDLVVWLINTFTDINTIDEAVEYGRSLMAQGLFRHADNRHDFNNGYFFYSLCSPYHNDVSQAAGAVPGNIFATNTLGKTRLVLSEAIQIDVDPKKLSKRDEYIQVHIDRIHNPKNSFHLQVEWLNATPRLVDDLFANISRLAASHSLSLVQVPVTQMARASSHSPFMSLMVTTPCLMPTECNDNHWFQHYILRKNGFLVDLPDLCHSQHEDYDIDFSWGLLLNSNAQYIHATGVVLAQITPAGEIALTPNTIHISRMSFSGGKSKAGSLIRDLDALCRDRNRLQSLLDEAQKSRDHQNLDDVSLASSRVSGSTASSAHISAQASPSPALSPKLRPLNDS